MKDSNDKLIEKINNILKGKIVRNKWMTEEVFDQKGLNNEK